MPQRVSDELVERASTGAPVLDVGDEYSETITLLALDLRDCRAALRALLAAEGNRDPDGPFGTESEAAPWEQARACLEDGGGGG